MPGLVDFTKLIVGHLNDDVSVEAPVFGNRLPERTSLPAIRIVTTQAIPATAPTREWWSGLVQIDCFTMRDTEGFALASAVQDSMHQLEGTASPVVVADVSQSDISFLVEEEFTPPAARHIVSVAVTARNPSN
jgi:hypothetical protein